MQLPSSSEQYITIVDNRGREKVQAVEYIVWDVNQEKVFVTADALAYTRDSLTLKRQTYLVPEVDNLSSMLSQPDIVIWDPVDDPGETLIYYKRIYIKRFSTHKVMAAIVKIRQSVKFLYNMHLQDSGHVKGTSVVASDQIHIWYLAPGTRKSQYGL